MTGGFFDGKYIARYYQVEFVALLIPHVAGDHQIWEQANQPMLLISTCTVLTDSKR